MPTLNEVMSLIDEPAPSKPPELASGSVGVSGLTMTASPLANRKDPYYTNKQERPAHRLMLEYAAQGYDVNEIAKMTGYTPVCVNNVLRQPYAQQTLVDEIRRVATVDDKVVEVIKKNVVKAVRFYQDVLEDPTANAELRMKAAEAFLNRRYGKPNQPFSQGSNVDLKQLSDDDLLKMCETNGTATSNT